MGEKIPLEEFRKLVLFSAKLGNIKEFRKAMSSFNFDKNMIGELYCQKSGDTVIHFAVQSGCLDILKYFGENFRDSVIFTRMDIHGKTPLHLAAQEGSLNCTKYLLSLSVPVDPFKKGDWTPLMHACARGHLIIVDALIKAGANPYLRNKDGWTAFHIASRTGCTDILKYLLDKDQNLCHTKSENGRTPLHTSALHGHLYVVDFLINCGKLHVDEKDSCGNIPLMDAVRSDNTQLLQLLLQKSEVGGEATDLLGRNILHIAAECGSNNCIKFIIQNKIVHLNSKSFNGGQTALHYAAKEGNAETLALLLCLGIDHRIQDSKGRTAADIAHLKEKNSCVQQIEHYTQLHTEMQI